MADNVYDVRDVILKVTMHPTLNPGVTPVVPIPDPIDDIAPDGFGITPGGENTLIEGLNGPLGFNIDPSSQGEATLALKPSSSTIKALYESFKNSYVLVFSIDASNSDLDFQTRKLGKCILQQPAEISVSGKEEPDVVFTFIGYDYEETY